MGRMTREQEKAMFAKRNNHPTSGSGRIKASDKEKLLKNYEQVEQHAKHPSIKRRIKTAIFPYFTPPELEHAAREYSSTSVIKNDYENKLKSATTKSEKEEYAQQVKDWNVIQQNDLRTLKRLSEKYNFDYKALMQKREPFR
jgi:hypothetical protein